MYTLCCIQTILYLKTKIVIIFRIRYWYFHPFVRSEHWGYFSTSNTWNERVTVGMNNRLRGINNFTIEWYNFSRTIHARSHSPFRQVINKTRYAHSSFVDPICVFSGCSRSRHYSNIETPRTNIHINLVWIATSREYWCKISDISAAKSIRRSLPISHEYSPSLKTLNRGSLKKKKTIKKRTVNAFTKWTSRTALHIQRLEIFFHRNVYARESVQLIE